MPTVFITGSSSGIGQAAARLFQERGWNVAATMRSPEKAGGWVKHERTLCTRLDVLELASIEAAVQAALERFGQIDVLVNNAGYGVVGPFEASTPEQVERQLATNVAGLMNVTRAMLPHFRERRSGVLVNVASVGGRVTFPLYSIYHATKWAVEGFSESLVYELEPLGIRVKLIEPGPIKTDFYERSLDVLTRPGLTTYDGFVARTLPNLQRAGQTAPGPEAVAQAIFRAATDGSSRLRYPVNASLLLALRGLLPVRWFMALMKSQLVKG
jgi:NAD(P)-dependent dehydrogenase (short-subunit alcohol dehydrogenase family)